MTQTPSLKFSEVEAVAAAMGVHPVRGSVKIDLAGASADGRPKGAAVFHALAPLFRHIVDGYLSGPSTGTKARGLGAMEADFQALVSEKLEPRPGHPSRFRVCWKALELDQSDSAWILHVVLVSLLQGIIRAFADQLGDQELGSLPSGFHDDTTDLAESQLAAELRRVGLLADSGDPVSGGEAAQAPALLAGGDAKWESQPRALARIWQNFSLVLLLQRGQPATSAWIERALMQPANSGNAKRKKALAIVGHARSKLDKKLVGNSAEAVADAESSFERRSTEFAALLLDFTLHVLGKQPNPHIILTENHARDVCRIRPSPELVRSLARISRFARLTDTSGPLTSTPKVWSMEGANAGGLAHGGLHHRRLGFYKFQARNTPIRSFLERMGKDPDAFKQVFEAVNALQDTRWRINDQVWKVMQALIKASDDVDVLDTGLGHSFKDIVLPPSVHDKWKVWLEETFFARRKPGSRRKTKAKSRKSDRGTKIASPGWRLISPTGVGEILRLAEQEGFYFAYNVDSRGRTYPIGGYLHPQGEDVFRSLLEFGEPKAITEKGVGWLALHGSECASRSQILKDMEIKGRSSPTIEERIEWVALKSDQICRCAEEPLEETWWREVGGRSAFQFLAFCFAWRDYKDGGPKAQIRLPVHVDGTCNGLQHIAALTGDPNLAHAVNLLPGDPRDIYLEIAEHVQRRFADSAWSLGGTTARKKPAFESALMSHQDDLRALIAKSPGLVDRDAAKQVVMVIPYGAGVRTYADSLRAHMEKSGLLEPHQEKLIAFGKICLTALKSRKTAEAAKVEKGSKLTKSSKPILPDATPDEPLIAPHLLQEDENIQARRYGSQMLATLIAWEFQSTLDELYPVIREFKNWLQALAACATARGIPLAWVSPTGFPVLQNGFKTDVGQIDLLGVTRIRLSQYVLKDEISERRQLLGILPNYIHSLDSAHMARTIVLARAQRLRSFSMIHDSFGTHASDMPVLARTLREAFVEIYRANPLDAFWNSVRALIDGNVMGLVEKGSTSARIVAWVNSLEVTTGNYEPMAVGPFHRKGAELQIGEVLDSEYFFY